MIAGTADKTIQRNKLLLSTINLEPELMYRNTRDAEIFLGKDFREFYESTGQPYQRGYLLYGPPGTGSTSISVAIASHFNVPLILVTLKGMDDKDLMDAFSRLPSACVVLLEDVDCAGAEVANRDTKVKGKSTSEASNTAISDPAQDAMLRHLAAQQAAFQQHTATELLRLKEIVSDEIGMPVEEYNFYDRKTGQSKSAPVASGPFNANKKVTLSCLLNVIDGADAAEGRLLLMTTNCPEVLHDALLRAGRVDEKFKNDYAAKVPAKLTFKRIFGLDRRTRFKPATINRFAEAFAAQSPSRNTICTAALVMYCGQYRFRPEKAVEEFADWLQLGNDKFAYRRKDLSLRAHDVDYNIPEAFDPALLQVGPSDFVDTHTEVATAALPTVKTTRSERHPASWLRRSSADEFSSIRDELLASTAESPVHTTFFDSFCASEVQSVADIDEDDSLTIMSPRAIDDFESSRFINEFIDLVDELDDEEPEHFFDAFKCPILFF